MTLFGLIRHGQTDWNAKDLFQGSSDIPLNDVGRSQASEAAHVVADHEWNIIVSSTMKRAAETADIIAAKLGKHVSQRLPELVERDWGSAEGKFVPTMLVHYPNREEFPGVEPADEVLARGFAALDELARSYPDQKVLIVSHGTMIRYLMSAIAGKEYPSFHNARVTMVERAEKEWTISMMDGAAVTPNETYPVTAEIRKRETL